MTDFRALFIQYQDYLAPRLDVYEQALYLYIARHMVAAGQSEAVIGFKSALADVFVIVRQGFDGF